MTERHEMPDPKQVREILDVVAEKVPGLLKELSMVLYSPDSAKQFGIAGATFYKELIAAGMTDVQAFELTQQYMSAMNVGQAMKGGFHHHEAPHGRRRSGESAKTA